MIAAEKTISIDEQPRLLLHIFTAVLWLMWLGISVLGLIIPSPQISVSTGSSGPVNAEMMNVQVLEDSATPKNAASAAKPAPQNNFIVPLPPKIVALVSAPPAFLRKKLSPVSPPVQHLTYGQGEGQQPAPNYPRESIIARQQGTIVVRFTVNEDGRVESVQAISPCPFPLLNQAAVRAVSESWRFRSGNPRVFEVSIQFQLRQR